MSPLNPPLHLDSAAETPHPIRKSRKQVSRACDWCRVRRIKCDNGQPCKACLRRGAECTLVGVNEPRTLPQALREIEKLQLRVKELENELMSYKNGALSTDTPELNSESSSHPAVDCRSTTTSPCASQHLPTSLSNRATQWEGIHIATARSDQSSYYGPISNFYFVSRMGKYVAQTLQEPFTDRNLQPRGANKKIHLGDAVEGDISAGSVIQAPNDERNLKPLSRAQEESFIRFFWEGYHCTTAIVDETEFRKHFVSLWDTPSPRRRHSPLVDIILALCLQYGHAFVPRNVADSSTRDTSTDEAAVAGRCYYRRTQSLLTADLESPSITTVQCYILSAAYLCCASFHNMCHIITAQAIRSAQVLGLHLEPPGNLPLGERELRKRIWWTLWALDAKVSSKLGRPFLIDWSQVTVTLPSDSVEAASFNGASLGSFGPDVTWLTYSLQNQKLFLTVVDVYDAFFIKCGKIMSQRNSSSLYTDPEGLETCAKFLASKIAALKAWAAELPMGLKTNRRHGGQPYSADRTSLDIDSLAPIWLQRQRLLLELIYHSMIINLTRSFITFGSNPGIYTPTVEQHATTCVDHAISHTMIMHQALTESDVMSGWSDHFSWQWNAAITIVGFILANPIHPATPRARQAVDKAIAIFDIFGENFAVSADAAMMIRGLMTKADKISSRLSSGIVSDGQTVVDVALGQDDVLQTNLVLQNDPGYFNQFMDWTLSVDSFNSFNSFFDANNPADPWAFGQIQGLQR